MIVIHITDIRFECTCVISLEQTFKMVSEITFTKKTLPWTQIHMHIVQCIQNISHGLFAMKDRRQLLPWGVWDNLISQEME